MRMHLDPTTGVALPLPEEWETLDTPPEGTALVAVEPAEGDRFRTNVVVTLDDVGPMSLRDWQAGNDRLLPNALRDYVLIDLELLPVDGHDGVRRLAHHTVEAVTGGPQAVTMEQWATVVDGTGYTVTVSAATLRHPELHDELRRVAAGVRLDTGKGRP